MAKPQMQTEPKPPFPKQKLAKPHSQGLSNVLDTSNQNKKPNLPFGSGGNNQNVSHNQTYGADVNRAGVPRRTPG